MTELPAFNRNYTIKEGNKQERTNQQQKYEDLMMFSAISWTYKAWNVLSEL
jgi:hypothetical protein